jgi:hypothetical protein
LKEKKEKRGEKTQQTIFYCFKWFKYLSASRFSSCPPNNWLLPVEKILASLMPVDICSVY